MLRTISIGWLLMEGFLQSLPIPMTGETSLVSDELIQKSVPCFRDFGVAGLL